MKGENKRSIGSRGEDIACGFLTENGYKIIERNYYAGHCEIDIICENEKYLVFVEVKARSVAPSLKKYGRPAKAVNAAKRKNIVSAAKEYVKEHPTDKFLRLDVIEIDKSTDALGAENYRVNHMKGAFGAEG